MWLEILKVFVGILAGVGGISGSVAWLIHKRYLIKTGLRKEAKYYIQDFIFQSQIPKSYANQSWEKMINAITLYNRKIDLKDIETAYFNDNMETCINLLYSLMRDI